MHKELSRTRSTYLETVISLKGTACRGCSVATERCSAIPVKTGKQVFDQSIFEVY